MLFPRWQAWRTAWNLQWTPSPFSELPCPPPWGKPVPRGLLSLSLSPWSRYHGLSETLLVEGIKYPGSAFTQQQEKAKGSMWGPAFILDSSRSSSEWRCGALERGKEMTQALRQGWGEQGRHKANAVFNQGLCSDLNFPTLSCFIFFLSLFYFVFLGSYKENWLLSLLLPTKHGFIRITLLMNKSIDDCWIVSQPWLHTGIA